MKVLIILVVFVATLVSAKFVNEVLDLNPSNFWDTVSQHPTMVLFYAYWGGHCKRVRPEWDIAAKKAESIGVNFAKIDCESGNNKDICSQFKIVNYPTLKFIDGPSFTMSEYFGSREADAIVTYAKKAKGVTPLPSTIKIALPNKPKDEKDEI